MNYAIRTQQYKDQDILTATSEQLIVKLYKRLLRELRRAEKYIRSKELEAKSKNLVHANDIVLKLMEVVNHEQGGQIAQNLSSLYNYFSIEILTINRTDDIERLKSIQAMVEELLETWKEAVKAMDSPV